jgi:hypothetical protein
MSCVQGYLMASDSIGKINQGTETLQYFLLISFVEFLLLYYKVICQVREHFETRNAFHLLPSLLVNLFSMCWRKQSLAFLLLPKLSSSFLLKDPSILQLLNVEVLQDFGFSYCLCSLIS